MIGCPFFHCESDISSTGYPGSNIPPAATDKRTIEKRERDRVFIGRAKVKRLQKEERSIDSKVNQEKGKKRERQLSGPRCHTIESRVLNFG